MEKERSNFIGAPQFFNLNHAVLMVNQSFGKFGYGTYLVGSSLKTRNFRDVDVRCIIEDEAYDRLFPGITDNQTIHPLWSLMCAAISEWLSSRTGLPIDFQIQKISDKENKGDRNALGIFSD